MEAGRQASKPKTDRSRLIAAENPRDLDQINRILQSRRGNTKTSKRTLASSEQAMNKQHLHNEAETEEKQ